MQRSCRATSASRDSTAGPASKSTKTPTSGVTCHMTPVCPAASGVRHVSASKSVRSFLPLVKAAFGRCARSPGRSGPRSAAGGRPGGAHIKRPDYRERTSSRHRAPTKTEWPITVFRRLLPGGQYQSVHRHGDHLRRARNPAKLECGADSREWRRHVSSPVQAHQRRTQRCPPRSWNGHLTGFSLAGRNSSSCLRAFGRSRHGRP
jgi:hypothetical protein